MAVQHRQRDMAQAIIEYNSEEEWNCGNRVARLYRLTEIDTYVDPTPIIDMQMTTSKKPQDLLPARGIELAIWNEVSALEGWGQSYPSAEHCHRMPTCLTTSHYFSTSSGRRYVRAVVRL